MLSLHGVPLALQVAVPIALIAWLAGSRHASIQQWLAKAAGVLLYLAAVHVAGLWVVLPWYTAAVLALVGGALALWQWPRVRGLPWAAPRLAWPPALAGAAIVLVALAILVGAGLGRRPPAEPIVDLEFPLRNGVYHVVAGGSVELVNAHLMTRTAERFRAFRGQSYGVDLLKLDAYGRRASGLLPRDPARYTIYGEPVHAPCAGVVVQVEDGAADMPPPQPDRTRMAGNHVLLECKDVHVLLAHFQPGSVGVRRGERLDAGVVVGRVGNSGNSNEPHLHVHAQRPAAAGNPPFSGDPLPVRFDGRYLVRNDRVAVR